MRSLRMPAERNHYSFGALGLGVLAWPAKGGRVLRYSAPHDPRAHLGAASVGAGVGV